VIKQWLEGVPRDMIAANNGLSAGAVTNIVNEWREGLEAGVIDDLRELGVTFRKVGITPLQCALGFRTAMLISKLGVREEQIDSFISDLVRSIDLGLSSENISFYIRDLLEFSKTNSDNSNYSSNIIVPLGQISEFVQHKAEEKKKLEEEIQTLKNQIKILNEEKSNSEERRNSALHEEYTTDAELKSFSELKQELGDYGLPIYDIPKFAKAVRGLRQNGYDVPKIIKEYTGYEDMKRDYFFYQAQIPGLETKCSELEEREKYYTQRLSFIDNLQDMGFDFKELKSLWHTIVEISDANNISIEDAVRRFFKEIEDHYDDILGFESRKHELEAEVNGLGQQKLKIVVWLNAFTKFGGPFEKLLGIMNSTSPEEINLLVDKLYSVGGVRIAIEKLSTEITLSVGHETNAILKDVDSNNSKAQKNITSELTHLNITYQENSTTVQPANDRTAAVLSDNDYHQDDKRANVIGKIQEDDPSLKDQINMPIDCLHGLLKGDNSMENKIHVGENDNAINVNHQDIEETTTRKCLNLDSSPHPPSPPPILS
jgi:predicted  nucleic acid-binding Zn-ribbon protein